MAKKTKTDSENPRAKRWFTLGHLALRIALMVIVFLQVNYLSCRRYDTIDLSRNKKFTLSDRTSGFLRSLGADVKIVTAFLGSSDILPDVKSLISEYDRVGGDRVSTENLDLSRSRNRISELKDRHKINFNRDQVLILSKSGRIKMINAEELVNRDPVNGRIIEFLGEEKLTSALLEVTEQQQKKIYISMGGRKGDELVPIARQFAELANAQNARLESLDLNGRQSIPADADALILPGNTSDLGKRELEMVREFWEIEQGGLFILLDPAAKTENLNSLLRDNGVFPKNDRVLTSGSISGVRYQKVYDTPVTIMPGFGPTRDLPILSLTLLDRTQSLEVMFEDDFYIARNIRPQPLLLANPNFWGETHFDAEEVSFNPDFDNGRPDPVFTGAAIEKGAPGDPSFEKGVSRLVVVSNPNLISPDGNTQKTAADFCMASLNWVMSRENLLGISPKKPTSYNLYLRSSTFGLLQTLLVWVFPAVMLFAGALVWYRRRA